MPAAPPLGQRRGDESVSGWRTLALRYTTAQALTQTYGVGVVPGVVPGVVFGAALGVGVKVAPGVKKVWLV